MKTESRTLGLAQVGDSGLEGWSTSLRPLSLCVQALRLESPWQGAADGEGQDGLSLIKKWHYPIQFLLLGTCC